MIKHKQYVVKIIIIIEIILIVFLTNIIYHKYLKKKLSKKILGVSSNTSINAKFIIPGFEDTENDYYIFNEVAGHLHRPDIERMYDWPEYINRKIILKTNNLGFRSDSDTEIVKNDGVIRILVTGDSHTDGVINNVDSFSMVLEKLLSNQNPSTKYEVINAGVGYYGPQNYLGVLDKWKTLSPNIFIVTIYTGNDFIDSLRIESDNQRLTLPKRDEDYYRNLNTLEKSNSKIISQSFGQIYFFKNYPSYIETALNITKDNLSLISEICKTNNIKLLVVLLPSKTDIEPYLINYDLHRAMQILKFNNSDLQLNKKISSELSVWLNNNNYSYVNLYNSLHSEKELFWKTDYHLNDNGHASVAKIIFNKVIEIYK